MKNGLSFCVAIGMFLLFTGGDFINVYEKKEEVVGSLTAVVSSIQDHYIALVYSSQVKGVDEEIGFIRPPNVKLIYKYRWDQIERGERVRVEFVEVRRIREGKAETGEFSREVTVLERRLVSLEFDKPKKRAHFGGLISVMKMNLLRTLRHVIHAGFYIYFCFYFFQSSSQALQIDRVQSGRVTLDSSAISVDFNLQYPVDSQKAFLSISQKVKSTGASEASMLIAATFKDRNTVQVKREQSGAEVEVSIYVLEFKNGVKVTHGVTQFSNDVYQKRIIVPRVNNKSAAVILMPTAPDFPNSDGAHLYFTSYFSDASTLSIKRSEGAEIDAKNIETQSAVVEPVPLKKGAKKEPKIIPRELIPEATVYWQILEFSDGVKVTQGSAKIPHFSVDTNAYLVEPIQSVDRSFMFYNWIAGQKTHGKKLLSTLQLSISDKSVLLFARPQKGSESHEDLEIQWSLLELESASSLVQQGSMKFEANESEKEVSISGIFPGRSFVLLTASGGDAESNISEAQQSANLKFTAEIIGTEKIRVSRGQGDASVMPADVRWSVVQFSPVSLSEPRGEELWFVGDRREIKWDYSRDMTSGGSGPQKMHTVDVRLSMNDGVDDYPYILASEIPVVDGRYSWLIPDELDERTVIGKNLKAKIQISEKADSYFDVSKKPFEIKGVLRLISPRGGEVWHVGEDSHEIKWEYKGLIGILSIYYDTESGYGANPFPLSQRIMRVVPGKKGIGSFVWTSLPDISSTRTRVKIVSEADKDVVSLSENDFSIIPDLKIVSPSRGADPFDAEKSQMIKWQSSGTIQTLNLYYRISESDKWILSVKNIPGGSAGLKSYRWFVPAEAVSEELQIKLEKAGDPDVYAWAPGDGNGSFAARSWIVLNQPSEVVTRSVGDKQTITWNYGGSPLYLNFEYSVDDGETWIKEAVLKAQDKKFIWTIPDAVSNQVEIRLSDVKNKETFCVSQKNIRIIATTDSTRTGGSQNPAWWVKDKSDNKVQIETGSVSVDG